MFIQKRQFLAKRLAVFAISFPLVLTGCGANLQIGSDDSAAPLAHGGIAIHGNVHGGVYPIQQATVRLMETQSNGYGGKAIQLLPTSTQSAVLTDGNGNFTFTDTSWTCDTTQYLYLTVTGGFTSTNTPNNNVVQTSVLSSCANLNTQAEFNAANVFISELSTVAAAYALGNFTTIDTTGGAGQQIVNISAPANNNALTPGCGAALGACKANGLGHGFASAANLVNSVTFAVNNFPSGQSNANLPTNQEAIVPQAMINTLGNILQSCVDSPGVSNSGSISGTTSDGTNCGDLFRYATTPGGSVPTNTMQAVLNMAKYPTNNVTSLFALQPRAIFFTPGMSSAPQNLSLTIFYQGLVIQGLAAAFAYPVDLTLDSSDNVHVLQATSSANNTSSFVDGIQADGTALYAGAQNTSMLNPSSIAADNLGYLWASDDSASGTMQRVSATSGTFSTSVAIPNGYPAALAVDKGNNVWVARDANDGYQSFFRYSSSGAQTAFGTTCVLVLCIADGSQPMVPGNTRRIAIDANQNLIGVTTNGNAIGYYYSFGSKGALATVGKQALNGTAGFGVTAAKGGNVYIPLDGEILQATATAGVTSTNASAANTYTMPGTVAMDGNGSLYWPDMTANGKIYYLAPASGAVSAGTLVALTPCYLYSGSCSGVSKPRSMALDSAGDIWYIVDNGSTSLVVETLGLAAPTWPLLAYPAVGTAVQ